jgi:hypothetical protein
VAKTAPDLATGHVQTTEGLGQHGAPADMTPFRHAQFCVLRDSIDRGSTAVINSSERQQYLVRECMNSKGWTVAAVVWESQTGASTVVQQKGQGMEARFSRSHTRESYV